MKTWQDFLAAPNRIDFIKDALNEYRSSGDYLTALDVAQYEKQQNTTINAFVKWIYTAAGTRVVDTTASNTHICSNFFHRLNTARCTYSLGNGVSFSNTRKDVREDRQTVTVDVTKQKLGRDFDTTLYNAAFDALEQKVSYLYWNLDRVHEFKMTEFCPLLDEDTGALMGGIRFWSLDWAKKPVTAVLYEPDGFTKYRTKPGSKGLDLAEYEPKRAYKQQVAQNQADGEFIVGESNYSSLPIVPLYGTKNRQSTLIGLKEQIDAYDLINSGFANDLQDCAEIYWLISDAMGTTGKDIQKFRDQIKFLHMAVVDTETPVHPYTQEIPTEARTKFLESIQAQMYRDFAVLDVHTVAAGATNDHIDAAYQPMEEEADDFEYQIIQAVRQLLSLIGIDDVPQFKRNRISNQKEMTEMIMLAAQYLDDETLLSKLPFVTVDEIQKIMAAKDRESAGRFTQTPPEREA